jgi:hypothetical protein
MNPHVIDLDHALFAVLGDGGRRMIDLRMGFDDFANGLVFAQPGAAMIHTGIATGKVYVTVEVRDTAPTVEVDDWDEVAAVAIPDLAGPVQVGGIGEDGYLMVPLSHPGDYRMLVQVRGRDLNYDGVAFEPEELYALTLWPAPLEPETVFKATDECGASWRLSFERDRRRRAGQATPRPTPPQSPPQPTQPRA